MPSHDNGLNTTQINHILKNCKKYGGICSKDTIPHIKNNYWYIVNMENSVDKNGDPTLGTHWICFIKQNSIIFYFDAFGIICPLEILNISNNNELIYNKTQIQNEGSSCCGWFCIALILSNNKYNVKPDFENFISRFDIDTKKNDLVLKLMLFHLLNTKNNIKVRDD